MIKTKIDYNSTGNQEIKGKFVAREVKELFSYEMEAILRASEEGQSNKEYPLPSYDDIENLYDKRCSICEFEHQEEEEYNHEPETQPQEIYEWWIVTDWLAKKLQNKGEPILEWGNNFYWGRTCTGQAILLDGVISEICEELEILEGQKNDWNKYK